MLKCDLFLNDKDPWLSSCLAPVGRILSHHTRLGLGQRLVNSGYWSKVLPFLSIYSFLSFPCSLKIPILFNMGYYSVIFFSFLGFLCSLSVPIPFRVGHHLCQFILLAFLVVSQCQYFVEVMNFYFKMPILYSGEGFWLLYANTLYQ